MTTDADVTERVIRLEGRLDAVEHQLAAAKATDSAIFEKLDKIEERLSGRPSWAVTAFLTLTTSTAVGSLVALASRLGVGG